MALWREGMDTYRFSSSCLAWMLQPYNHHHRQIITCPRYWKALLLTGPLVSESMLTGLGMKNEEFLSTPHAWRLFFNWQLQLLWSPSTDVGVKRVVGIANHWGITCPSWARQDPGKVQRKEAWSGCLRLRLWMSKLKRLNGMENPD